MNFPNTLPDTHRQLLITIIEVFSKDTRILGIGASGSYASNSMDKYSDLDLVIAVTPEEFENVMNERFEIIDRIEGKVAAFTGEHVGEPRLVITLFEPNALHIDFKFVALPDAASRVDDTKVVWERDRLLSDVYKDSCAHYPQPDPQWIEDRFWTWIHYGVTKIGRGEYFEALEFISFLRSTVLAPLALTQSGQTPSGVRTIEKRLPVFSEELLNTIAIHNQASLISALQKCIDLYRMLREKENIKVNHDAEKVCIDYFCKELDE